MSQIKILASGKSKQEINQARGKLFEELMAKVLRHYGYQIDNIPNVNYSGMEIDIEGRAIATGTPLYAECKCYENPVSSPKLQTFYGKYIAMWFKDKKCQGLFIAMPGINSHAAGFYKDNCENNNDITLKLLNEDNVIETLLDTALIVRPEEYIRKLTPEIGQVGDRLILYTSTGLYWLQYIVQQGSGIPTGILVIDNKGNFISDNKTIDYLAQLYPEIHDFERILPEISTMLIQKEEEVEEIIEVRGSSECFEYQFPASPEYFVGRQNILKEVENFIEKIINNNTSSRGILFEANSGFGKSSLVLASVSKILETGNYALAIDSRSASSSQFILRVIDHSLDKFNHFDGIIDSSKIKGPITGFEGAIRVLTILGEELSKLNKVLFIFLDQFENIFFQVETLKRISDLILKLCDKRTNIVFGFSWKTDLVGLTSEFPYLLRDSITNSSNRIQLDTFTEIETNELLDRLSEEIHAQLRKDLRFLLSEFSQGYPWLLKKLCAHVKFQREEGIAQSDMANSLLNVNELFLEDLKGLSPQQEDALRNIARKAPISVSDISEDIDHEIIQSLVNQRLVVRIGTRFDIYWDIFRDYLNTGRIPVQENFILRVSVSAVLNAANALISFGPKLTRKNFRAKLGLSENTFFNLIRDLRLLDIVNIYDSSVELATQKIKNKDEYEDSLRNRLSEKLPRNRIIRRLLEKLQTSTSLTMDDVAIELSNACPYISASDKTWNQYAKIFSDWLDFTDLALFDWKEGIIRQYKAGSEIRGRRFYQMRSRKGLKVPLIQYNPVEKLIIRIVDALTKKKRFDSSGIKESTYKKSLAALEDLQFIKRETETNTIIVSPEAIEFALNDKRRREIFIEKALKLKSFSAFLDILNENSEQKLSQIELGKLIRKKLGTTWSDDTSKTNVKIMLDWARNASLVPAAYESIRKKANNK